MNSALLHFMWHDGWRLGVPIAVTVESRASDNKWHLEQAFVGFITNADHSKIIFTSSKGKCRVSLEDVDRKIYERGRRLLVIKTARGEIKIGQNLSFAKQVAYWARELLFAQYGQVGHA